jgi:hypothetical protein
MAVMIHYLSSETNQDAKQHKSGFYDLYETDHQRITDIIRNK